MDKDPFQLSFAFLEFKLEIVPYFVLDLWWECSESFVVDLEDHGLGGVGYCGVLIFRLVVTYDFLTEKVLRANLANSKRLPLIEILLALTTMRPDPFLY